MIQTKQNLIEKIERIKNPRMLKTIANFDNGPADNVVENLDGKVSYGYLPESLTKNLKEACPAAPVLMMNEVYEHVDLHKGRMQAFAKKGYNDIRECINDALGNPDAVVQGADDKSLCVFSLNNDKPLALNLIYVEAPVSCYMIRTVLPCGNDYPKGKTSLLAEGENMPSLTDMPKDFSNENLKQNIENCKGEYVSGLTFNKGNVLKMLRFYAAANVLPNTQETAELKNYVDEGALRNMPKPRVFTTYITEAMKNPNFDIFVKAAQECGAWRDTFPELGLAVDNNLLEALKKVDDKSAAVKFAMLVSHISPKEGEANNKSAIDKICNEMTAPKEYSELAKTFSENYQSFVNAQNICTDEAYDTFNKISKIGTEDFFTLCEAKSGKDITASKNFYQFKLSKEKELKSKIGTIAPENKKEYISNIPNQVKNAMDGYSQQFMLQAKQSVLRGY